MVLSPQAQRAWKLGTAVVTSITSFHVVFQVDYGDQEHVFTDLQKWYRGKVDDLLIGGIKVKVEDNKKNNDNVGDYDASQ
mmetsp:Transcript_21405/g.24331  ORF Transcript_21405/g.24331 Transcript_21405/m.24331 type:complete len:80 (-) Transcript_21405:42-281(-)